MVDVIVTKNVERYEGRKPEEDREKSKKFIRRKLVKKSSRSDKEKKK